MLLLYLIFLEFPTSFCVRDQNVCIYVPRYFLESGQILYISVSQSFLIQNMDWILAQN